MPYPLDQKAIFVRDLLDDGVVTFLPTAYGPDMSVV